MAQTVFVVVYGMRTPWHHGFVGRALFLKSVVVWLLFANSLVRVYWPYPHEIVSGTVLMWLLAFAVVYQCAALIDRLYLDRRAVHSNGDRADR